jgi:hypothetical protein
MEPLMSERCLHTDTEDLSLATLRLLRTTDKHAEYRHETFAVTLCFVRGTGGIAFNGNRVEYGGKWFEIQPGMDYEIFPETDTVMLTLQKPTSHDFDTNEDPSRRKHP